ncbi:hypothetical protein O3P69_014499 [Scylla paramamosain]|uniref:Uncharacterized protein n=1 Tax=Scylla paramamosain TaxID=85552 RepID=A0AAW0TEK7_SCYPA
MKENILAVYNYGFRLYLGLFKSLSLTILAFTSPRISPHFTIALTISLTISGLGGSMDSGTDSPQKTVTSGHLGPIIPRRDAHLSAM